MLKNFGYGGIYRDENISVSVLLENPLEYGIEANKLVFSVVLKDHSGAAFPELENFSFYVMDESKRLYNARSLPYLKQDTGAAGGDDEPVRKPDGLIITDFNHDFLFQNLRIAFSCRNNTNIRIIELKH